MNVPLSVDRRVLVKAIREREVRKGLVKKSVKNDKGEKVGLELEGKESESF